MSQSLPTAGSQLLAIFYEVLPQQAQEADPAQMQSMAHELVQALRKEGYTVQPVATGARGADLLFQIIPLAQATVQMAIVHKDQISQAIDTAKPIIEYIITWRKQHQADKAALPAQSSLECEVRLGQEYDTFSFKVGASEGIEEFRNAFEKFLAHSQHARPQNQSRVVEQAAPTLTIREHVPPRPRKRK